MTDTVYTMNLAHKGVTKYTHMAFTRIGRFKDKIIGIAPDGYYTISKATKTANGTNITSTISSGQLDFGTPNQKRIPAFYLGYRAAGDILVSLQNDAMAPVTYTLPANQASGITQRRILAARGRRGRYWKVTLQNVNGAEFDIDNAELFVENLKRRI
jgi:hypothetical protein